jgi:hypothetical protein
VRANHFVLSIIAYPFIHSDYDDVNPNTNPICGRQVTASCMFSPHSKVISNDADTTLLSTDQGKSVTMTITDRCTGCKITDLDMSPSAFNTLANPSLGRIDISWDWDS